MLEAEIVRKCLARSERQCSFVEHREHKARVCSAATRVSCRSFFFFFSRLTRLNRLCTAATRHCTSSPAWTRRKTRWPRWRRCRRSASLWRSSSLSQKTHAPRRCSIEALDRYFGSVCEARDLSATLFINKCRSLTFPAAGHHVPSGQGTLHFGGDHLQRLRFGNKPRKNPVAGAAVGQARPSAETVNGPSCAPGRGMGEGTQG